jgi:hypothetical protein
MYLAFWQVTPFSDIDPLIPILIEEVGHSHIIDLVDMKKYSTMYQGQVVSFIWSCLDEKSRKLWLEPIAGKTPEEICYQLRKVWSREGPPKLLRNDCGKEFQGINIHNLVV